MPDYRIRKADGLEYGPVNAEALRQGIASRQLFDRTLIKVEGTGDWKELSKFPEFSEALAAARLTPPAASSASAPALPIAPAPLPNVVTKAQVNVTKVNESLA